MNASPIAFVFHVFMLLRSKQMFRHHFSYRFILFYFIQFNSDAAHGGQRVVTVLMYLSTPEEGGETVFPNADEKPNYGEGWSDCARRGLSVKAVKGNALLFYSLHPDGTPDIKSTHGSCPVS